MESLLLAREDMLVLLRIRSLTTLDALVKAGDIPAPLRMGRRLLWHRASVERWLAQAFPPASVPATPTDEPAPRPRRRTQEPAPTPNRDRCIRWRQAARLADLNR